MSDYIILDHADAEVSVIVDMDEFRVLPVVAAGPNRATILQAFVDSTPFDVGVLSDDAMRIAFVDFLERSPGLVEQAPTQDYQPPLVTDNGSGGDEGAALAAQEAANATDVPPPAPADTDQGASENQATSEVTCWNCNGVGTVQYGEGEPPAACNMCKGTGKVKVAVAA